MDEKREGKTILLKYSITLAKVVLPKNIISPE